MLLLSLKLIREYMTRHRLRTMLTVLGVALGVAAVVSIRLVNRTVLGSFQNTIDAIAGKARLQIVGRGSGLPEELVRATESLDGVVESRPLIEGFLSAGPERLLVLGVDLVQGVEDGDSLLGSFDFQEGDPQIFIANGDSIALTETIAKELNLSLGSKLSLMTTDGLRNYTARAFLTPSRVSQVYGGRVALMDLPVAQAAFGKPGKLTQIDLRLAESVDPNEMRGRLQALVGDNAEVMRPRQRGQQIERLSSSFRIGLTFVSFVTLAVGLLLVYNTSQVAVTERRKEIGILRSLGARRRDVLALFFLEALLVGLIASILGIGAGFLIARASLHFVAETVDALFLKTDMAGLVVSSMDLASGVLAGEAATLLGALLPALRASAAPPVTILNSPGLEPAWGKGLPKLSLVLGFVLIVSGVAGWFGAPVSLPRTTRFTLGVVASLSVLLGLSFFSAHLLRGLSRFLAPLLERVFPVVGRVAVEGAVSSPWRSGVTMATLVFSLATILSIAALVASIRRALERWVDQVITADLVVSSSSRLAGPLSTPLADGLGEKLREIPGVQWVDRYRSIHTTYRGEPILVSSWDSPVAGRKRRLLMVEGDERRAFQAMEKGAVLVSESFGDRFKLHLGDRVTLVTDLGRTTFGVAGVFVDYTSDVGGLLMDRRQYQRFWHDSLVDAYDLWLAHGGDSERVAGEIRQKLGGKYELFVSTHVQIKGRILRLMRDSFRVNYAMESVAILVAVMGLVQNLLASAVDRTRQFGVLRALGAQKRDLRASLTLEAGLIGLAGGLLGVVGGALISFHHVVYNTKTLTGWSFSYIFPWGWGLGIVLGAVFVSALVGLWIGARVARQGITSSIQYE